VSADQRTLADEAALAKAYLRVLPEVRARRVDVAIDIAQPVQRCPFPRKVLLPLVAAAAAAGAARIRLVGTPMPVAGGPPGVEVSLRVGAIGQVPGWTAERCTEAQRLLAESFGPAAKVERRTLPEGVALVLTCPVAGPDGEEAGKA
jgi:hypothetical protein